MNRIYRIVWSHTIGAWVVADERARARGKRATTRNGLAAAVLVGAVLAIGGPGGPQTALADTCPANEDLVQGPAESCEDMVVSAAVDLIDNSGVISGDGVPAINVDGGSLGQLINRESGEIDSNNAPGTIRIRDGATVGSIDNQGVITGPGIAIRIQDETTSITGGITNSGLISSGTGSLMIIGDASITGGIENRTGGEIISTSDNFGAIRINGSSTELDFLTNDGLIEGNTYGIYLQSGATVTGDVRNQANGQIIGNNSHGLSLIGSSTIGGDLVNSGVITGGGHGLHLDASTIAGEIVNEDGGEIFGSSEAILINNGSTVDSIINNGSIETSNADSAIRVENSTINGEISNDGVIAGGSQAGLYLVNAVTGSISSSGEISGGQYGLWIADATISGDIRNEAGGEVHGGLDALRIDGGSVVEGSVWNSGLLTSSNFDGLVISDNAVIAGSVINNGEIDAETTAIHVSGNATVGGSILNSGELHSAGTGIALHNDLVVGDVRNDADGEIDTDGSGIHLDTGLGIGGSVVNHGTIVARGDHAIRVNGATVDGQVVNDGAISGALEGLSIGQDSIVGEGVHNTAGGEIDASEYGIRIQDNADIGMNGDGVALTNAGSINAVLDGIRVDNVALDGDVMNSGSINAVNNGIRLASGSTLTGDLINGGTILSDSDGIVLDQSTVSGDLLIGEAGLIDAADEAIQLQLSTIDGSVINHGNVNGGRQGMQVDDSVITGGIVNHGMLSGDDIGIEIIASAAVPSLINHGTIEGGDFAMQVSLDSDLDAITIAGDSARFIGDVLARDTAVTLESDAVFANDNAFEVLSFHVGEGALLRMGSGVSSSFNLDDGIATTNGFVNDGTIEIAAGDQPVIHGDYIQGSGATLNLVMIDTDQHSRLIVSDTATVDGIAFVDVSEATILGVGQVLEDVISAGNVQGNFSQVDDNSLLFDFVSVASGNAIDFEVVRGISAADIIESTDNPAAGGVAEAIDDIIDSGVIEGDMQALINALGGLADEQQFSAAMSQLLPLMTASQNRAILSSLHGVQRAVQSEQTLAGNQPGDHRIWARPFGSWADQDNRKGVAGHEVDTFGVVIGADTALAGHSRIGIGLSLSRSDVDSKSPVAVHSADIDSYSVMLYSKHAVSERTAIDLLVDHGWHDTDGERRIAFGDLDRIARADYSSTSLHLGAGMTHVMSIGTDTRFLPSLRVGYTRLSDDGYEEQGADTLGLQVDSHSLNELILSVDGRIAHDLNARTTVAASLGLGYDLIDDQGSVTARLSGAPDNAFVTRGLDTDPLLLRAGLGFDSRLTDQLRLHARYDIESRSDYLHHGLSLQFSMTF